MDVSRIREICRLKRHLISYSLIQRLSSMAGSDFFDRLFILPLFQGMAREDFLEIAGQIRLGFHTLENGDVFAAQGITCDALYFVIDGDIKIIRNDKIMDLKLVEWGHAPMVAQPPCLFGLDTRFFRTFEVEGEARILRIDKQAVRKLLTECTTFRMNYMNLLSAYSQRLQLNEWQMPDKDLGQRFIRFVENKCLLPTGRKEVHVKMETLARCLLASRLRVSRMLSSFKREGLIELSRERVAIPSLEKVGMYF